MVTRGAKSTDPIDEIKQALERMNKSMERVREVVLASTKASTKAREKEIVEQNLAIQHLQQENATMLQQIARHETELQQQNATNQQLQQQIDSLMRRAQSS